MKGVEIVHIYSKTWWEEFRVTDNEGIRIVSNYPTVFSKIFCITRTTAITVCRVAGSLLVEYKVTKRRERWPELVNVVGDPIFSR